MSNSVISCLPFPKHGHNFCHIWGMTQLGYIGYVWFCWAVVKKNPSSAPTFWGCFWCERLEERHALVFFLTIHMGWGGVGLYSRSFNLHTLVMHTPWMLRYSWGGAGWGCIHVPSTCTRWWCTRHECYGTHGVGRGGAVFTFLQLAHAGDAHAMNATVLMGWRGVGLCSCSTCTCWWCTRHECYGTHGLLWGGAVFMFLQLAHAGDAHAMKATVRYSWVVVGWGCVHVPSTCTRWWCARHECYGTHGVVWVGGVMLTFNWIRTPTWCYAQLLHLHKRCHVGVERFGRLLTVNMIGCNRPRSAGLLLRFHAWLHWLGCQLVWRKYRVHIFIYL